MKKFLWIFVALLSATIVLLIIENRKLKNEISGNKELFMLLQRQMEYKDKLLNLADSGIISKTPPGDIAYDTQRKTLRIKGDFLGWNGSTVFELNDGSVWQQAIHDVLYYRAVEPEVTILEENGQFFLSVNGVERKIKVIQIR